jgi:hypothetical protein
MKTRKNIYLIAGIVLIILNLIADLMDIKEYSTHENASYSIGYFIGSNIFHFVGIMLVIIAYKVQKRIKAAEINKMIDNIGKD